MSAWSVSDSSQILYAPAGHMNVFVWSIQDSQTVRSNLHSTIDAPPRGRVLPQPLVVVGGRKKDDDRKDKEEW